MDVHLPRFRLALARYAPDLTESTFYRYLRGDLPRPLGGLLLADPALCRALADDVEALQALAAHGGASGVIVDEGGSYAEEV